MPLPGCSQLQGLSLGAWHRASKWGTPQGPAGLPHLGDLAEAPGPSVGQGLLPPELGLAATWVHPAPARTPGALLPQSQHLGLPAQGSFHPAAPPGSRRHCVRLSPASPDANSSPVCSWLGQPSSAPAPLGSPACPSWGTFLLLICWQSWASSPRPSCQSCPALPCGQAGTHPPPHPNGPGASVPSGRAWAISSSPAPGGRGAASASLGPAGPPPRPSREQVKGPSAQGRCGGDRPRWIRLQQHGAER